MERIFDFIRNNITSLLIGLACFGVYLYFTIAGNRICDCESTENYKSTSSGSRSSYNHFYHK
ncbi:hypothetical protein ABXT06_01020 [Flavobacterium sp. UW10123]|uniref:hypothetical protein n=1 Tax=Flavobacterium sp. UW10123 TaxID=3230800 RepID=UPI00339483D6